MSTSGPAIPVPLDESWTSWWHQANRVVFQRGIELRKTTSWGDSPYWEVIGKSGRVTVSLEEFCKQVALAPVLLGIENQEYSRTFLVPSNAGLVLEMALQQLQTHLPSSALLSQYGRLSLNQWYITSAVVYHCRQLVEVYPRIIASFFKSTGVRQIGSDRIVLSNQIEPYFEFEALVTTVVRVFETARYLVWRVYGTQSGPPRNFQGVIEQAQFPGEIAKKMKEWVNTYAEAKGYRDCIQHNAHFGARLPFSMAETVGGGYWSLLVRIPDNPEVKSYNQFTYEKKLDALDYGWALTSRVFRFTDDLLSCVERR